MGNSPASSNIHFFSVKDLRRFGITEEEAWHGNFRSLDGQPATKMVSGWNFDMLQFITHVVSVGVPMEISVLGLTQILSDTESWTLEGVGS